MSAITRLSVAAAVGMTLSLLATGEAFAYTFTKIATTQDRFTDIIPERSNFNTSPGPAINDEGIVAFVAKVANSGIFTGSGGKLTAIAYNGDCSDITSIAETEKCVNLSSNPRNTAINKGGTVASLVGSEGIKIINDGNVTSIPNNDDIAAIEDPVLNNNNTVAFYAELKGGNGIFISTEKETTPIARSGDNVTTIAGNMDSYQEVFQSTGINDSNTVAFYGRLESGNTGIFASFGGGKPTPIADTSSRFKQFGDEVAVNNDDTIAFFAQEVAGDSGIFIKRKDREASRIIDTKSFGKSLALNNGGTVAFLDDIGIFTGLDSVPNKVIAVGDTLDGFGKVTNLLFSRKGLNNQGQIAFFAKFEDKTIGIFRADPDSAPQPKPVPEPASVLGLLAVSAVGATSIRRKQKLG